MGRVGVESEEMPQMKWKPYPPWHAEGASEYSDDEAPSKQREEKTERGE